MAEGLRRLLWVWVASTRRKRLLADREEEVRRSRLLRAWESWQDRYIENGLRNIVRPSQKGCVVAYPLHRKWMLFFNLTRTCRSRHSEYGRLKLRYAGSFLITGQNLTFWQTLPAVRFRARHTKLRVWKQWRAAMPLALKAKEAREHDQYKVFRKFKCLSIQISPKNLPENVLLRWQERYKAKIAQKAIAFVFPINKTPNIY